VKRNRGTDIRSGFLVGLEDHRDSADTISLTVGERRRRHRRRSTTMKQRVRR